MPGSEDSFKCSLSCDSNSDCKGTIKMCVGTKETICVECEASYDCDKRKFEICVDASYRKSLCKDFMGDEAGCKSNPTCNFSLLL